VRPAPDGVVAMDILLKSLTSCNPIFICPERQDLNSYHSSGNSFRGHE
jgi:hypothetical protein